MKHFAYVPPERLYNETYPTGSVMFGTNKLPNPNDSIEAIPSVRNEIINGFNIGVIHTKFIGEKYKEEVVVFVTSELNNIYARYSITDSNMITDFNNAIDALTKAWLNKDSLDGFSCRVITMCIVDRNIKPTWIDPICFIQKYESKNAIIHEYADLSIAYEKYQELASKPLKIKLCSSSGFIGSGMPYYCACNKTTGTFSYTNNNISEDYTYCRCGMYTIYSLYSANTSISPSIALVISKLYGTSFTQAANETPIPNIVNTCWGKFSVSTTKPIGNITSNTAGHSHGSICVSKDELTKIDSKHTTDLTLNTYYETHQDNTTTSIQYNGGTDAINNTTTTLDCNRYEFINNSLASLKIHEPGNYGYHNHHYKFDKVSGAEGWKWYVTRDPNNKNDSLWYDRGPGTGIDETKKSGIPASTDDGGVLDDVYLRPNTLSAYDITLYDSLITMNNTYVSDTINIPNYGYTSIDKCYIMIRPVYKLKITQTSIISHDPISLSNGLYELLYSTPNLYLYYTYLHDAAKTSNTVIKGFPVIYGRMPNSLSTKEYKVYHNHAAKNAGFKFTINGSYKISEWHHHNIVRYSWGNHSIDYDLVNELSYADGYGNTFALDGNSISNAYNSLIITINYDDAFINTDTASANTGYGISNVPDTYTFDFTIDKMYQGMNYFWCSASGTSYKTWIGNIKYDEFKLSNATLIDDTGTFKRYKLNKNDKFGWYCEFTLSANQIAAIKSLYMHNQSVLYNEFSTTNNVSYNVYCDDNQTLVYSVDKNNNLTLSQPLQ